MDENIKPLKFYKNPLYYSGMMSIIGISLVIFSIIKNNSTSNITIPATIVATLFGILTYFMWNTKCPKCKRAFMKTEDSSKEKDLGIKKIKRKFDSEIFKTKEGSIVKITKDYKIWPARFIQRFYFCKRCNYGRNDEWHDKSDGIFKKWEDNEKWNPPKPKIIIVKMDEDENYKRTSRNKKRIPIKTSLKRELFDRAENACQHCGHTFGLDIHHIDENPANNGKTNLIILCANCHRMVGGISKIALKNEAVKSYKKSKTINIYK